MIIENKFELGAVVIPDGRDTPIMTVQAIVVEKKGTLYRCTWWAMMDAHHSMMFAEDVLRAAKP